MGKLAPPLAQLLFLNPVAPRVFAFMAGEDSVKRLVGNMGSTLDREGLRLYRTLMGNPTHVTGALGMMANWELDGLARDLPRLAVPLTLVTADRDRAVPPDTAARVKVLLARDRDRGAQGRRTSRARGEGRDGGGGDRARPVTQENIEPVPGTRATRFRRTHFTATTSSHYRLSLHYRFLEQC